MSSPYQMMNRRLHEMVLIYNAVMDGWTVRKKSNGKIKFTRKRNDNDNEIEAFRMNLPTRQDHEDDVRNFIDKYISYDSFN